MSKIAQMMQAAAAGAGSAPPEFLGYQGVLGTSGKTISFTSFGLQQGDLVIFFVTSDDSPALDSGPSGYTGMHSGYPSSTNVSISWAAGYKVMGATPDVSLTIDPAGSGFLESTDFRFQVVAFRNVGTPSSTPDSSNTFDGPEIEIASLSITDDNSVVVYMAAIDDDFSTATTATGYTQAGLLQMGERGTTQVAYQLEVPSGTLAASSGSWSTSDPSITYAWIIPPA